jgi:hypothetical protein
MTGELLRWIMGAGNVKPRGRGDPDPANLLEFSQKALLPAGATLASAELDQTGFVYAPRKCRTNASHSPLAAAQRTEAAAAGGGGVGGGGGGGGGTAQWWDRWPCTVHVHYHPCGGSYRAVSTSYMMQVGTLLEHY